MANLADPARVEHQHEYEPEAIDPIVREVVRGGLRALQAEMEALIERTAMSAFIREKKDYFAGVFDPDGQLIVGTNIPVFGDLIRPILERYPVEAMQPGDIYWYNDCYASHGAVSHSPDQVYIAPIFVDGRVSAFIQSWAHFTDIGGMRPGSLSPDAIDIFQEGTMVPPMRLYTAGVFNEDAFRIFQRNSRYPDMVLGDTRASVAAVRLGERRILEIFGRYGRQQVVGIFESLIAETEATIRRKLKELFPRGTYSFADYVDSDGHGNGPFGVRFDLISDGERFTIDTTRSDDQAKGPINYLMHPDVPGMILGIYLLSSERDSMLNEGAARALDGVTVREGSILQPKFPAPLGQRGVTLVRVINACCGLLGLATKGQSVAANNAYGLYYLRGEDSKGEKFLLADGVAVGYGARSFSDGIDAVYFVAQENYPAEFLDLGYPVRLLRYEINCDTGGPGCFRGGAGVIRELEFLGEAAMVANRIDCIDFQPWGLNGGMNGGIGRCVINPGRPDERVLPAMSDGVMLKHGDIFRIETGGGGGWGHPFDRDAERVHLDVLGGFVSRENAERDYGVVLTGDRLDLDIEATNRRRKERRQPVKMFHRGEYTESFQ